MRDLFVVGDSISMHYGPHLAEELAGSWSYARKTGEEPALQRLDGAVRDANGGDSDAVRAWLEAMVPTGWHPDLLLLNCGLHDMKTTPATGAKQVPVERYRLNLEAIATLLAAAGIATVWVRTTPVDDATHNGHCKAFHRFAADVDAYNAVADAVMTAAGVPLLDLYAFSVGLGVPAVFCDHVHYTDDARRQQAAHIAAWIRARY